MSSMTEPQVEFSAFRQALLKSERFRILIVLGSLGVVFLVQTIRTVASQDREDLHSWFLSCLVYALFGGFELLMLHAVKRATRADCDLPILAWVGSTIVETSLPALGVAFMTTSAAVAADRPLANPAALGFFLFIILSTLRLNPWACRICGSVAAVTYLVAAFHLGWRPALIEGASLFSPPRAVVSYAIAFLIGGFAAGAVAGEVRKHVNAALREAEVQRQLDRLEHDMQVARSIQQSLLPSATPLIKGFEIAGWNQPADQTGGDYFDWQLLPSGRVVVALGDVTGHGIGSALLAAVCRAYARANFTVQDELLAAMRRINTELAGDMTSGRFVTFVAVVCEPGNSRVQLLSAGQGPLFIYWLREDRFDTMGGQALPLGISPRLISEPPLSLELHPGDLLVLATDGLFEWANGQGEQFGAGRLEQVVRAYRHLPPKEMISTIYGAVVEFSGGTKQQDDLTAVIIKRT
jgi:serine phosphatase RsbU (regulator of sigma subunit)